MAQAIPNYIMSCYKIPEGCCHDIESLIAKFWWGSDDLYRKVHWMSWDRMGRAKDAGGMGFRSFSDFNRALLGKQCWRLISDENTLMAKVFKSRYYPRSNFMGATAGYQPSYTWRSMLHAKEVTELGSRWVIGDGQNVGIWTDSWLPEQTNFKVWSKGTNLQGNAKVVELIDHATKQWRRDVVFGNFSTFEAQQIINIPLSCRLPHDKLIWHRERDGNYSVRSAYHLLCDNKIRGLPENSGMCNQSLWKEIWRAPVPNSVRNFLWRLGKNILPTRANLPKKGMQMEPLCPLCNGAAESQEHLFMYCQPTQLLWFTTKLGIHVPSHISLNSWLLRWLKSPDQLATQLFCITLWKIWWVRNQIVFNKGEFNPIIIAGSIADFTEDFNMANKKMVTPTKQKLLERWEPPDAGTIKLNIACIENIILDCRELMSHLHNIRVFSIKRGKNVAAHGLVGVATNLGSRSWLGYVPEPVSLIICNDLPVI